MARFTEFARDLLVALLGQDFMVAITLAAGILIGVLWKQRSKKWTIAHKLLGTAIILGAMLTADFMVWSTRHPVDPLMFRVLNYEVIPYKTGQRAQIKVFGYNDSKHPIDMRACTTMHLVEVPILDDMEKFKIEEEIWSWLVKECPHLEEIRMTTTLPPEVVLYQTVTGPVITDDDIKKIKIKNNAGLFAAGIFDYTGKDGRSGKTGFCVILRDDPRAINYCKKHNGPMQY